MHALDRLQTVRPFSVIAHRGGAKLRPENTMAAFDYAAALGVDAFECDVHLSRDGEPVVIHDDTLDRTTDATGPVSALSARELRAVDAGHQFQLGDSTPFRGKGEGVPRLSDLLERHAAMPIVVEIKGDRPETAARALGVVRGLGAEDRVVFAGFSDATLGEVRRLGPALVTSATSREARAAATRAMFWLGPRPTGYRVFQVPLRLRGREVLRRRFVRAALRGGVPVHVWVIDQPDEMRRLHAWGVSGFITDRPDLAMALRRGEQK